MPVDILMPALSPTMQEGSLRRWLVKEGDTVASGDVIAEVETDKATMEVEVVDEGRIGRIVVPEGENVPVRSVIAVLLQDGEEMSAAASANGTDDSPVPKQKQEAEDRKESQSPPPSPPKLEIPNEGMESSWTKSTPVVSMSVREALRDAMAEEMRRDDRVFLFGEEVGEYQGAYKVSQGLLEEFGENRVFDTPITEHGFTGLAVGAAFAGLRPVVEFMTFNFAMQAMDQIINSAAKMLYMSGGKLSCPIVFRGPNGAAARVTAQHSQDYSAWYAHIPGLKVVAPYTASDAKGLLKAAIRDPNPVVFLENEILYGHSFDVPEVDDWILPIGKARVLRAGADVTIVSYSHALTFVLEACEKLSSEHGIEAEVIDLRSLRPLDMETILESVRKSNRIVVVEQGWGVCGIGAEVSARVCAEAFDYLDAPPMRVSGEDVPMPYAANLEALALPDANRVIEAARAVCYAE
ncbi:MAG: pyruvate dehydrogenase complex E1 component subunit beta [Hyphomicrobiales bacterium]|nr:pyruvate dehydrogenase complex E1 component subunit beta [Hyphomicrobiales bacterium]MCY4049352.1 pyruvate dehydrogenase complex E1 component subunit beta [Hyphomicrobiales bacterium]MCY4053516.1 pyruvate dehydrogenase complex E1 component subunit beta [Hyphomicrobiales bacterium]